MMNNSLDTRTFINHIIRICITILAYLFGLGIKDLNMYLLRKRHPHCNIILVLTKHINKHKKERRGNKE